MNPQTGEILAMVSLPTYDDNLFARGHLEYGLPGADRRPEQRRWSTSPLASNTHRARPTSSSRARARSKTGSSPTRLSWRRPATSRSARTSSTTGTGSGFGPLDIYGGFSHSSDTFFYQLAGDLGADRLAQWAHEYGFGERTGIDLPAEARGSSRPTSGSRTSSTRMSTRARSTRPVSARATTPPPRCSS